MNDRNGHDIEDLQPGMAATFSKTITEADIVLFAGVSGDTVHVTVTVTSLDMAKARAVLATGCRVRNTVVIEGEAHVMTTSRARREAKPSLANAAGAPAMGAAVAAS